MHRSISVGYVILCLVVPLGWGVLSSRIFDWWQAHKRLQTDPELKADRAEDTADMYHI